MTGGGVLGVDFGSAAVRSTRLKHLPNSGIGFDLETIDHSFVGRRRIDVFQNPRRAKTQHARIPIGEDIRNGRHGRVPDIGQRSRNHVGFEASDPQ